MKYLEFAHNKPSLKRIVVGDKGDELEIFEPFWNKYSNSLCYFKLSKNRRKTNFGYTLKRAFLLLQKGDLEII